MKKDLGSRELLISLSHDHSPTRYPCKRYRDNPLQ